MSKKRNLLFVIADGERAKCVRLGNHKTLHNDVTLQPPSAHHDPASRHDMHALEKARFGRAIAQWLNGAAAANNFDELIIVAPPHTLVEVRQRLDPTTDARVIGTLAEDLSKLPDRELWPHLRRCVVPNRGISKRG